MRLKVVFLIITAVFLGFPGIARSQAPESLTPAEAAKKYEINTTGGANGGENASDPNAASAVEVTAFGKVDHDSCPVGGRIEYTLTVTVKADRGKRVELQKYDMPMAQGLDIVRQTQNNKKLFLSGKEITTIIRRAEYACVQEGEYKLGPVAVPYGIAGTQTAESSVLAAEAPVTVKPPLTKMIKSSKSGKWIAFVAGLAVFAVAAFYIKRRLRRAGTISDAMEKAEEAAKTKQDPWDGLAAEAAEKIEGDFYSKIEELFWAEAFYPDAAAVGAAATRISILAQRGAPVELLNEVRKVVNECQVGKFTGSVSRGDAMSTLSRARHILEKLSAYRPDTIKEDDHGTAG